MGATPAGRAREAAAAAQRKARPRPGPGDGMKPTTRHVFSIPLRTRFRGITVREGVLLEGPAGWGEFSPFLEYDAPPTAPWLARAWAAAHVGRPNPVRSVVPVNVTVPACD